MPLNSPNDGLFDGLPNNMRWVLDLQKRLETTINPLGKFYKQFEHMNRFEHLNRFDELARRVAGPAWLNNSAFTAMQHMATLYKPSPDFANITKGLSAFNQVAASASLPAALKYQSVALDLVQKDFFRNWNTVARVANQPRLPARIEQLQAHFGNLFARLAETSDETHTEEATTTASISADLLAIGNEILTQQRVTPEATSKLTAIAERYEQHAATSVAGTAQENQIAIDTLRATQQGLSIQIIAVVVSALMSLLAALLPIYLAQQPDPADRAVTQRQFADWQAQLTTFATHAAAPIRAERVALRSVLVRTYPRQTAEEVGQLLKGVKATVWATQGKWAQISYLDVDSLPTQGWVRRNCLGWPAGSLKASRKPQSAAQRGRR
jgi:hypothetical protein